MAPLKMDIRQDDTIPAITIVSFAGEMDSASIERISACFDSLTQRRATFVIAEMSAVSAVSSAALGELMGGRKTLVERNGDLVLAGLSLEIKSKLTLMGANKIFKFHNNVRGAINAYKWEYEGKPEAMVLSFPPELKYVPPVRQLVSRLAKQKGYGRRDAFRIETIVDEICNNAVEHRAPGSTQSVRLSIGIDRKKVEINVASESDPGKVDSLKNFLKPRQDKPVTLDDKRGRGLALIKLLSSELNIQFSESGTTVHATKLKEE